MTLGNRAQVFLTVLATIPLIAVVNTAYQRWNGNLGTARQVKSTDWKPVAPPLASDNLVLAPRLWRDLVRMGGGLASDTGPSTIVALLDHQCAVCDSVLPALRNLAFRSHQRVRLVVLFLPGADSVPPGTLEADCATEQGIYTDGSASTGSLRTTVIDWRHVASRLRIPDKAQFMACVHAGKRETGRAHPGRVGLRRLLSIHQTPAIWVNRVLLETLPNQMPDSLIPRTSP